MNRFRLFPFLIALLSLVAGMGRAAPAVDGCIAGAYRVTFRDVASEQCPRPGQGEFVVTLSQPEGCEGKVLGSAVRPTDKAELTFSGRVVSRNEKCCVIAGRWTLPEGEAQTRLHFCWRNGNLSVRGKTTLPDGCDSVVVLTRL